MHYPPDFAPHHARASLPIRIVAALIDFLLIFFIALPFSAQLFPGAIALLYFGGGFAWRKAFGAMPGQQLVGIRRIDNVPVGITSQGRQWLRALASVAVILYFGLLLSAGALIARLTDEKLAMNRVEVVPTTIAPPAAVAGGIEHRFAHVTFRTPPAIGAWDVELAGCCVLFGGAPDNDVINPGVLIFVSRDLHPFDYCNGVRSDAIATLSGCRQTPLDFQRMVAGATTRDRWKIWNPLQVIRTNFALVAKNIYFEETDGARPLQRFSLGDAEVLWLRGHRTIVKKKEQATADIDRFLIAGANDYIAIDIVWKKVARDPHIVDLVASTLRFAKPGSSDAAQELTAASSGDALRHLMNAARIAPGDATIAMRLRNELATHGTSRQRHLFALTIAAKAKDNGAFRPVAEAIQGW
jgi:hypothetical protein